MKVCISLLFLFISFSSSFNLSASNVLSLKRLKDGADKCDRFLCVNLPQSVLGFSKVNIYDLEITINQDFPSQQFGFPWTIKAFDKNDNLLGQSSSFNESGFSPSGTSNLRSISTEVTIYPKKLFATPLDSDCYVDSCGLEHSNITIVFKLFSASTEIDHTCKSFDHPDLDLGSHKLVASLKSCDCPAEELVRGKENNNSFKKEGLFSHKDFNSDFSFEKAPGLIKNGDIQLYPNPVSSKFFIETSRKDLEILLVDIISIDSKIVRNIHTKLNQNQNFVDVSDLSNGIYILRYFVNNDIFTKRIIVNN